MQIETRNLIITAFRAKAGREVTSQDVNDLFSYYLPSMGLGKPDAAHEAWLKRHVAETRDQACGAWFTVSFLLTVAVKYFL